MCSGVVVIVPSLSLRGWFCIGRAKHPSLMGWVGAGPRTQRPVPDTSLTVKLTAR
jgi:hypothetical protein